MFDFTIFHRPVRNQNIPDDLSRLLRDIELHYPSGDDEIPSFEYATVLAVRTCSRATADATAEPDGRLLETSNETDDDFDDPMAYDGFEVDAIDLYQAADLEADLDTDLRDALHDVNHHRLPDPNEHAYTPPKQV